MAKLTERVDAFQRRHRVLGVPIAIVYKFVDDQGNYVAMTLTHNAFVAVLPLLLISSSVLGFVLQKDESLKVSLLTTTLGEFPIIGTELSAKAGLQGSFTAVLIGSVVALYGVIGLGQAFQNAVNTVWSVPRNSRRNPVSSGLRSAALLGFAGVFVLLLAAIPTASSALGVGGGQWWASLIGLGATAGSMIVTVAGLALLISWAGPTRLGIRYALPGAVLIALGWHLLQRFGRLYVQDVLARASDVNAVFAISLGLLGFLYLASMTVVAGLEVNVVLCHRLFPRALLTPFTDRVELTDAEQIESMDLLDTTTWPTKLNDEWDIGVIRIVALPQFVDASGFDVGSGEPDALLREIFDRVPHGLSELCRNSPVVAGDGTTVGHFDGFVVNAHFDITYLVLGKGHLWRHREVTIPVEHLAAVTTDRVDLDLSAEEVGLLASTRFHRPDDETPTQTPT